MNFKKILTSAMLLLTLVLSCGKKAEEVKTEGLKGSITVQAEEPWVAYYEAAIARVKEKNPEAVIDLKVISSFDHLDVLTKTDPTNTDVADVFAAPLDRMVGLLPVLSSFDAKALADKIGGFKDFDKGLGGRLNFDGKYYGFPFNLETLILAFNPKNASANGVDTNSVLEFTNFDPEVFPVPVFNAWWGVSISNAFGVELLGQDGDKFFSDLTKPWAEQSDDVKAMFEGLYNYWKSANDKKLPIFDNSAVYGFMDELFKTGNKGSVRIIGPWEVGSVLKLTGDDFDVLGLDKATFAGKTLKHWQSGWALTINARNEENADNLALSEAVIAEIMNPAFASDFFTQLGKIMPNVSKEEYQATNLSDLNKKVISAVLDSYDVAVARPLFEQWGQVWGTWENALLSWQSTKPKNAEEAYKGVQASFEADRKSVV